MGAYSAPSAPHLHGGPSIAAFHWKKAAALLPLLGVCLFRSGFNALGILTASLLGGLAAEAVSKNFLKKKLRLWDGSSVLNSLLFALILPSGVPYWRAAAGAFFGLFIGREIFGGLAAAPFQSALAGVAFLEICFPSDFLQPAVLFGNSGFAVMAVLAGAFFLFLKKLIVWEVPFFYLASALIFFLPFEPEVWPALFSPAILFSAFFLLTDSTAAPVSVFGRRVFAVFSGTALFFFDKMGVHTPFVYALLTVNALSPWIDRAVRPKRGA